MSNLSEAGYECLRHAVTLAKNNQARSVTGLRKLLAADGHSKESIDEALDTWAGAVVTRLLPVDEKQL